MFQHHHSLLIHILTLSVLYHLLSSPILCCFPAVVMLITPTPTPTTTATLYNPDIIRYVPQITFLRGVRPHPDTRIIVSSLPDDRVDGKEKEKSNGQSPSLPTVESRPPTPPATTTTTATKYFYGCDTCLAQAKVPFDTISTPPTHPLSNLPTQPTL